MAYYNGVANDMSAVRQALVDACSLEGWSWNSGTEMLSKGAMFLRLQVVSGYLTLLGRTSAAAGDAPGVVRIGQIGSTPVTFPLSYEVFVFASEVYLVVNYSIDRYQWAAFGQSSVLGMAGSGMWVAATLAAANAIGGISISATAGAGNNNTTSAALFWRTQATSASGHTDWLHSDLDAQGWWLAQTQAGVAVGIGASVPLIGLLPNSWNSEAVLLPIRAYKVRPSSKISLIADLAHARHTRIDNYEPGEVINIGSDRWKVLPWHQKNVEERFGVSSGNHTGTFGWAIRYEGP